MRDLGVKCTLRGKPCLAEALAKLRRQAALRRDAVSASSFAFRTFLHRAEALLGVSLLPYSASLARSSGVSLSASAAEPDCTNCLKWGSLSIVPFARIRITEVTSR